MSSGRTADDILYDAIYQYYIEKHLKNKWPDTVYLKVLETLEKVHADFLEEKHKGDDIC